MSDEEDEEEESTEMSNDDWIKKQNDYLKHIKNFETKDDRLISVTQLSYMHGALCDSVMSWNNWVNGWVTIELGKKIKVDDETVVTLSDDELKDLHSKYKEFAIKFIELDIAVTEAFTKKVVTQKKDYIKKNKVKNESKMVV